MNRVHLPGWKCDNETGPQFFFAAGLSCLVTGYLWYYLILYFVAFCFLLLSNLGMERRQGVLMGSFWRKDKQEELKLVCGDEDSVQSDGGEG